MFTFQPANDSMSWVLVFLPHFVRKLPTNTTVLLTLLNKCCSFGSSNNRIESTTIGRGSYTTNSGADTELNRNQDNYMPYTLQIYFDSVFVSCLCPVTKWTRRVPPRGDTTIINSGALLMT